MSSDYQVILDACVLVNAALRDTLLRLAEPPCSLYLPRWTQEIMDETEQQTAHLFRELEIHFADAWVKGHESIITAMTNDPKDRHVLAAAVVSGAQTIVTFNVKHFSKETLAAWNVEVQSPDEFLIHQYHLDPETVFAVARAQAAQHGGWERLMNVHHKTVPQFVTILCQHTS